MSLLGAVGAPCEVDDMAKWVKREHGKGEIDKAGLLLVPWWTSVEQELAPSMLVPAYRIVQNWRTSHALPLLTFRMGLSQRAKRVEPKPLVAQRLKRFSSVMDKLAREPHMKLSQMHDLGGCRVILSSVEAVDDLLNLYRGPQELVDLFESEDSLKCYDYIRNPKPDGYRGIHIVGRYKPIVPTNEPWRGHRIEIQIRTQLQHAFATAVETVTTFTRHPLKFGGGPDDWRRFFTLMGSALAVREKTPVVAGVPKSRTELAKELREVTKNLKVRQKLAGWAKALKRLPRHNVKRFKWLLLVLNVADNTIKVTGFDDRAKADQAIGHIEQQKREDLDAVLVWVRSVRDLKTAYPNYYADTGGFIDALNEVLRA